MFQNSDENANINPTVNAIISIGFNTVNNALPNYTCKVLEYITNILDDEFVIPPIEYMEAVISNSSRSLISNISLDLSV